MPARRRSKFWLSGILGVLAAGGLIALTTSNGPRRGLESAKPAAIDESTALPVLARALRDSDARALAVVFQRSMIPPDVPAAPLPDAEAAEWVRVIDGMRAGFAKFGSYGRVSALQVATRVLQRFAAEPAPSNWVDALAPTHDVYALGLEDAHVDVRVAALAEVGRLWSWNPGRTPAGIEENLLADWKEGFVGPATRRLGDREPKTRAAAVACLGMLPIDRLAAPAIPYLDDPASPEVRKQVLISFAARRTLLSEDAVLKKMFDADPTVPEVAGYVLKVRGLDQEQISLGAMIFNPKPEIRASVIPLLKDRADVDPAVWLIQLSRDQDVSVRLGAVDALASRMTPEVGRRLAEMAATDSSPDVRRAASKHLLPDLEKTAAMPPLPGSPALAPKAN